MAIDCKCDSYMLCVAPAAADAAGGDQVCVLIAVGDWDTKEAFARNSFFQAKNSSEQVNYKPSPHLKINLRLVDQNVGVSQANQPWQPSCLKTLLADRNHQIFLIHLAHRNSASFPVGFSETSDNVLSWMVICKKWFFSARAKSQQQQQQQTFQLAQIYSLHNGCYQLPTWRWFDEKFQGIWDHRDLYNIYLDLVSIYVYTD